MSILLGALGGAGEQLSKIGADRQAFEDKSALENQQSDLALKRAQALEQFKQDLAAKPLMRLTDRARQLAREEVPVESTPVDQVTGNIPLADGEVGPKGRGFTGSIAEIRRGIAALPDGPDKTAAMKQLDAQVASDQKAADGIIAGARRKRTSREALDAAVDEARSTDLPALAAYETAIGKAERDERRIDVTEKKGDQAARAAELKVELDRDLAAQRDATQRYIAELRDETANRRLEALIAKMGGGANGTKEALSFIDGARKELANDAATLKSMYAADIKDLSAAQRAKVKAEYEPKFAAIEAKRTQIEADFNALREKVGLPGASASAPSPSPAPQPGAPETKTQPQKVTSKEQFDKLPSGTRFIAPDGTTRVKP